MEQCHHPNNNRSSMCLPVQSPVFLDHSRTRYHRSVMKEIAREQSLVTQLRAIVLPALQADERSDLVAQMFQNILDCSSKAMADLQLLEPDDASSGGNPLVDDKRRISRVPDDSNKEDVQSDQKLSKRRRFADSVPLETPVPHYDGRQWRKYGQENIKKEKHPRHYSDDSETKSMMQSISSNRQSSISRNCVQIPLATVRGPQMVINRSTNLQI